MIEMRNVTAGYGEHTILKDVSLTLEKGILTSVIGVNGCGKSTLLKTTLGMLPVNSGEIMIDGQNITAMNRNAIAKKVAYLSQGRNTPDMTVQQMVLHGRFPYLSYPRRYTKQDCEIASAAMAHMGISDLAHKTLSALSGGMRQNAYIAMALAQGTEYVLLDEPTTYLDIAHQLSLMKTLRKLADDGKGIVTVMHDIQMAFTFSDRIVLLHEGRILCNDTPRKVCEQKVVDRIMGISIECDQDGKYYRYRYENA